MFTSKQYTCITDDHFRHESPMGSGLVVCNMGYPFKKLGVRSRSEGRKTQRLQIIRRDFNVENFRLVI